VEIFLNKKDKCILKAPVTIDAFDIIGCNGVIQPYKLPLRNNGGKSVYVR
jgi:hypothetical protein